MTSSPHWCVLVNRVTCSSGWTKWQSFLDEGGVNHSIYHTRSVEECRNNLSQLYNTGHRHFLFCGGDGTIHHGGNALMELAGDESLNTVIGLLPCGTGNDWVRTYGIPKSKLLRGLLEDYTAPINLVKITWPDGRARYAFNMVGGGLDAAVVKGLRRASVKIPSYIIYPYGLLKALLKPHTWQGTIHMDDETYTGDIMTIQAGFAKYCGGGMQVLPHAREDSPGLLIMKPKGLGSILKHVPKIYDGTIIHQPESICRHFEEIEITHSGEPIPIEADGEFLGYTPVKLKACFDVMRRVV